MKSAVPPLGATAYGPSSHVITLPLSDVAGGSIVAMVSGSIAVWS
jgi:hypothetical protein